MERELTPREQFLRQMAAAQDAELGQVGSVAQQKARLRQRIEQGARGLRLARWLALPAVVAGVAAAAWLLFWPSPLTFAVGAPRAHGEVGVAVAAPPADAIDLMFSDGSFVALGPTSRARVTTIDARGAAILVERGHADVSIVPRKGGSWRVDAGPFEIQVKGTRFSFDWDPTLEQLDFRLDHGAVRITAPCLPGGRSLVAGQSLRASCKAVASSEVPASATPEPATTKALPSADAAASAAPLAQVVAVPTAPSWQKLAAAQDYRAALKAAIKLGFEAECSRGSSADLLQLGDVARLAGDPARAVQAYEAARGKRASADRSAFAIGLVEFDQRGRYARAAEWFATYIKEQPSGPLAEEAHGRLMDAWQRAGNAAQARAVAATYLSRYPRGQYADLARRLTRAE